MTLPLLISVPHAGLTIPFEVATYARNSLGLTCRCRFEETDPYLVQVREAWNMGIRSAFDSLPLLDLRAQGNLQLQPVSTPTSA